MVRRRRRRRGLGAWRARHEGPGGGRGRRRDDARPPPAGGRLAASCWSSSPPTRRGERPTARNGSARSAPSLVRSDLVVNEGGGVALARDGRSLYTVALGEKGVFRLTLRTRGRAGHASLPRIGDNALLKLAPLLERLRKQPDYEATPEGVAFLAAMLGEPVARRPRLAGGGAATAARPTTRPRRRSSPSRSSASR